MIRLAAALVVVSMVPLALLARAPTGQTAILFTFVGIPLVGLAILVYGLHRLREGAFRPPK